MNSLIPEYNRIVRRDKVVFIWKKVLYLSLFEGEESKSGAGFVKFTEKDQECRIDIQIKKDFCRGEGEYPLYFCLSGEEVFIRELSVQAGCITYSRSFKVEDGRIYIQGKPYAESDFEGIRIKVGSGAAIAGYLKKPQTKMTLETISDVRKDVQQTIIEGGEPEKEAWRGEKAVFATDMDREIREVRAFESKWDQLMNDYPQIHPFGDERVFISIEPKDFIILRASCQKLVNNSFLLHGFYNYRYLILGPDKEMGDGDGNAFIWVSQGLILNVKRWWQLCLDLKDTSVPVLWRLENLDFI